MSIQLHLDINLNCIKHIGLCPSYNSSYHCIPYGSSSFLDLIRSQNRTSDIWPLSYCLFEIVNMKNIQ